jgi:hypothetical protein
MEILAGVAVDHSTWDDKLTTVNDYDDVQCHWPYSSSVLSSYWNCECLGGKTLYFTATTNNLLVKILGSLDEGVTFPVTVESEFSVAVGTPVLKYLSGYFNALKIQVKPAVAGAHGTLSVIGSGSSLPGITDVELAGVLPDTAANDLAHIHAKVDNLNVGDQAKASSLSVTPATDIPDGRYIGDTKFGESLPAGTNLVGKVGIDQVTANANEVVVKTSALPSGASTEQGLDDILAKLSSDPATQTTLAAVLSKIIAAPATEAKQDTIKTAIDAITTKLSADPATQTTLAAILAAIATAAKQDDGNASLTSIDGKLGASTITDENLTLTVADTEYSFAIPANCKSIEFWSRNGYPLRYSLTATGRVATPTGDYLTLKSNCSYASPFTLNLSSKTIYFATDNAGDVVEILAWS